MFAILAIACVSFLLTPVAWAQTGGNVGIPVEQGTDSPSTTAPAAATSTTAPAATPTTSAAGVGTTTPQSAPGAGLVQPPVSDFPGLPAGVRFPQGTIQIMPEFDSQDVLVISDYQLPADVKVPFDFQFRVPKGARMTGYALIDANGGFDYNRPAPKLTPGTGDWDVVEAVVPRNQAVHIEYYYNPGLVTTAKRDFSIVFEVPAVVDQLTFSVQQPTRATGFKVTPPLSSQGQDGFGLTASSTTVSDVQPGELLKAQVAYEKPDANPSQPASSAPGTPGPSAQTEASSNYLLWLVVAMIVGVGGFAAYRMLTRRPAPAGAGGRTVVQPRTTREPGRTPRRTPAGGQRFCTGCGDPFNEDDRFCSQCGEGRQG